jgi:hypothetical protein
VKVAAEWLFDTGEAACVRRIGWRRVYDLPERVIPESLLDMDLDDAECLSYLVTVAVRALGVATRADIREHLRLPQQDKDADIDHAAEASGLTPVTIADDRKPLPAWADPEALTWLGGGGRGTHRTTLLSPFDSLIWDRKRTKRMFSFHHALEAYVPKEKRVHGYFTMPLLSGGRLLGRADPAREGRTLVARQVTLDRATAVRPMARALAEAAAWVGCDSIHAERIFPPHQRQPLLNALKELAA